MIKTVQRFIHQRHQRLMEQSRIFADVMKRYADRTIQVVNNIKRFTLERYSNTAYESEYRYGTHVWLYIAISTIAEKSSMAPLVLKNDEGEIIDAPLPPIPNECMSWVELDELITIQQELCGNAYIWHDRSEDEYWPLRPSRMKVVPNENGRGIRGYLYYKGGAQATNQINVYSPPSLLSTDTHRKNWMYDNPEVENMSYNDFTKAVNAIQEYMTKGIAPTAAIKDARNYIPFDAEDILHFKHASPTSDYYGLSPLTPLLVSLQTDLYARQWNQKFFENGAIPPGILIMPTTMSAKDFERRKKEWHKEHSGVENRGKVLIVQGGSPEGQNAQFTPFPGQHRDLEFAQGLNVHRDEVLALYNVPHVMVNAQLTATHSSSLSAGMETMRRIFWRDTIQPKHKRKASVWDRHFDYDPKMDGIGFGHDYKDIEDLAVDYYEAAKAATLALKSGMTIEEVRREIYKLPEQADDPIYLPSNLMGIEQVRKNAKYRRTK